MICEYDSQIFLFEEKHGKKKKIQFDDLVD